MRARNASSCRTSPTLSLTLFPEIGGQFKISRAEVFRGCELCDIRVLFNFETVETTDIGVQRQQFTLRPSITSFEHSATGSTCGQHGGSLTGSPIYDAPSPSLVVEVILAGSQFKTRRPRELRSIYKATGMSLEPFMMWTLKCNTFDRPHMRSVLAGSLTL